MADDSIRDNALTIRQGANLPHWTRPHATYAVTFRLADSLPRAVLKAWIRERDDIVATARELGRELSDHERRRLHELHSEKVETYLDAGHGACFLRDAEVAGIVVNALRHFDGVRYDLDAWCLMPNHVHVVLSARPDHPLPGVLHSWKSYTATASNRQLGRAGVFWQTEYYDHLIRDKTDFDHALRYVAANPAMAGLRDWPWAWAKARPA